MWRCHLLLESRVYRRGVRPRQSAAWRATPGEEGLRPHHGREHARLLRPELLLWCGTGILWRLAPQCEVPGVHGPSLAHARELQSHRWPGIQRWTFERPAEYRVYGLQLPLEQRQLQL